MENEQTITAEQIEEMRERAHEQARKATHEWKQRGPWIVCRVCPFEHGFRVQPHKRLVGISEDGTPILEDRE